MIGADLAERRARWPGPRVEESGSGSSPATRSRRRTRT
jgi:hypothetical protein